MPHYLPGSFTACYQVCTLLGPTALLQNAGTLSQLDCWAGWLHEPK